jgi:hypothetical protein
MRAALRLDEGALEGFLVLGREKKKKGKDGNRLTVCIAASVIRLGADNVWTSCL